MNTAAVASRPQAIPGAETQTERVVVARWPSIATLSIGRVIGQLIESAPQWRMPLLNVRPALAPALGLGLLAAPIYLLLKVLGRRYTVTSRRVMIQKSLTRTLVEQVALEDVAEVAIAPFQPGQAYFEAADVVLQSASGDELMRMPAVVRPGVFRQNILESRDALVRVNEALATIQARSDA
tara:strand:+ start:889 stop:1431 length:543 start_codon:yes stop_codon:yes gene_type:complete